MIASEIIQFARDLSRGTGSSLVSDDVMVTILNKSYKDFYKAIVRIDRNYFWDSRKTSTVANQYEYDLKKPTAGSYGIFKPEKIRIKYTSTSDYKDVEFRDWDSLIETPEWYAVNQSTEQPFAIMTDTRFFHIFPTPLESVTNGLILDGAKKPYNLTIDSTESDILIDPIYHETIAYMMLPAVERKKGYFNEKNDSINEADKELQTALKSMGLTSTKVVRGRIQDLSVLE